MIMMLNELDDQELYELAQIAISNRISLISAGKVSENNRSNLAIELQTIFKLSREQLIKTIKFHTEKYRIEKS